MMKKRGFWLVILFVLGAAAIYQFQESLGGETGGDGRIEESSLRTGGSAIQVTAEQIYQGDLLLVNKKYPVHEQGIKSDVVNLFQRQDLVQGYGLLNNTIRLSEEVADKFGTMVAAAAADGVRHFLISSGYRDAEEQEQLYKERGSDFALPAGYSEHNLGLSLDIGSSEGEMGEAEEGKWLKNNAWRYGFILRYPEDKTEITGIQYEPWHFRYVGLPHSAIMQENNFTLEEYLSFLKDKGTFSTRVNGEAYEVSYYPIGKKTSVQVPANQRYALSGNNIDGVIVTVYP